jgi:N-acetylmuramoyl-L-alanine amidase
VKIIQEKVGVTVDGKFGKDTQNAVIKFQLSKGLDADGVVGIKTWKKLLGVR